MLDPEKSKIQKFIFTIIFGWKGILKISAKMVTFPWPIQILQKNSQIGPEEIGYRQTSKETNILLLGSIDIMYVYTIHM